MRRVVITGLGVVSSIGTTAQEVTASLRDSKSDISFSDDYAEHGFRSRVHGKPEIDLVERIDKRQLRFMGDGAAYNYIAMEQAIADSGLEDSDVSNENATSTYRATFVRARRTTSLPETARRRSSPRR